MPTPRQQLEAAIGSEDRSDWWLDPNSHAFGNPRSAPAFLVGFDPSSPAQPWYLCGPNGSEWRDTAQKAVDAVRSYLQARS